MATLGLSKVFILDKYFTELQKFWETEKKLQGEIINNAAMIKTCIYYFNNILKLSYLRFVFET